ncbi:MAG TPA: autotransporter domain-containing protein, partial [Amaricoccus sp.]|nr:autotransporter domain-containing protein [Amaricoccus sp.]
FDFEDFDDFAAQISYGDTDSLAGRIGARVARSWLQGTAEEPFPATVWGRANIWHEFLDNPTTTFSGGSVSVPFTGTLDDTWGELEVGADMQANEALSFYGDMSYQMTFDGDADSFGAEVGLKWRW